MYTGYGKRVGASEHILELPDGERIERWMKRFGLFEAELTGYLRGTKVKRHIDVILKPVGKINAYNAANSFFGSNIFTKYVSGINSQTLIYYLGAQQRLPGATRFVYEALDKELPLLEPRIIDLVARNPEGVKPRQNGINSPTLLLQLRELSEMNLIRWEKGTGTIYPTPKFNAMFSKEIEDDFEEFSKEWKDYKVPVFRKVDKA